MYSSSDFSCAASLRRLGLGSDDTSWVTPGGSRSDSEGEDSLLLITIAGRGVIMERIKADGMRITRGGRWTVCKGVCEALARGRVVKRERWTAFGWGCKALARPRVARRECWMAFGWGCEALARPRVARGRCWTAFGRGCEELIPIWVGTLPLFDAERLFFAVWTLGTILRKRGGCCRLVGRGVCLAFGVVDGGSVCWDFGAYFAARKSAKPSQSGLPVGVFDDKLTKYWISERVLKKIKYNILCLKSL